MDAREGWFTALAYDVRCRCALLGRFDLGRCLNGSLSDRRDRTARREGGDPSCRRDDFQPLHGFPHPQHIELSLKRLPLSASISSSACMGVVSARRVKSNHTKTNPNLEFEGRPQQPPPLTSTRHTKKKRAGNQRRLLSQLRFRWPNACGQPRGLRPTRSTITMWYG
jgi:hypothetical protein